MSKLYYERKPNNLHDALAAKRVRAIRAMAYDPEVTDADWARRFNVAPDTIRKWKKEIKNDIGY